MLCHAPEAGVLLPAGPLPDQYPVTGTPKVLMKNKIEYTTKKYLGACLLVYVGTKLQYAGMQYYCKPSARQFSQIPFANSLISSIR